MKKRVIYSLLFLLSISAVFGQQYTVNETIKKEVVTTVENYPKNEIRFNLFESVIGLPEINYERFLDDNFGVGLATAFSVESVNNSRLRGLALIYGRLYLGNTKPCTGFYIEGNTGVIFQQSLNYNNNTGIYTSGSMYSGLGLGVAAGYKFLTKNNWIGEFSLGGGRAFGTDLVFAFPRVGVTIGKRF